MKRLLILFALILLILPMLSLDAQAAPAPVFYSAGLTYQASGDLDNICGRIATVIAESDKPGMAGIEQDIVIEIDEGKLTLEIINWYYGKHILKVGYVLYGDNGYITSRRVRAELRASYTYNVSLSPNGISILIQKTYPKWKGQQQKEPTTVLSEVYPCNPQRIIETSSWIEYWRYEQPGSFVYYGYVTIDDPQFLSCYCDADFYYKSPNRPFDFYFIHHNWDGNYFDKGEVDDR